MMLIFKDEDQKKEDWPIIFICTHSFFLSQSEQRFVLPRGRRDLERSALDELVFFSSYLYE
jgi:hypothetical protein